MVDTASHGCGSNHGASTTIGPHPQIIIQPLSVFCASSSFQRRSNTVPNAQLIAAPRMNSVPAGERCIRRKSSPRSKAMPDIPSPRPMSLRRDSGSCNNRSENSTRQTGMVKASIADLPAGICCTPNTISPFQAPILKIASAATLAQNARGMAIESPASLARIKSPMPANGSDAARKVSGASSVTPTFSTGQLQPHNKASMPISMKLEAGTARCAVAGRAALMDAEVGPRATRRTLWWRDARRSWTRRSVGRQLAELCLVHLARLRHPLVAHDASRKFRKLGIEIGAVALAPPPDLPESGDAEIMQHAFEHRADADDELQVVGLPDAGQDRRRRIVLDVDDERSIARAFLPRVGELRGQSFALASLCD